VTIRDEQRVGERREAGHLGSHRGERILEAGSELAGPPDAVETPGEVRRRPTGREIHRQVRRAAGPDRDGQEIHDDGQFGGDGVVESSSRPA
jgi:hypothetical protein